MPGCKKTNHSCRVTCATRLYESGMDDHGIMRRTGNRSTDGLKPYKRMGEMHHVNSSAQIDTASPSFFMNNVRKEFKSGSFNVFNFNGGCNVTIYNNSMAPE